MSFRATTQGMPRVFPYPEPQFKGYCSELQLKEHFSKSILRYQQSLVDHTYPKQQITSPASALSPSIAPKPPGEFQLQTAWQSTFVAKHQAS